jgi:hypothetical protein
VILWTSSSPAAHWLESEYFLRVWVSICPKVPRYSGFGLQDVLLDLVKWRTRLNAACLTKIFRTGLCHLKFKKFKYLPVATFSIGYRYLWHRYLLSEVFFALYHSRMAAWRSLC